MLRSALMVPSSVRTPRRRFLAGSVGGVAAGLAAATAPVGRAFAGGAERLRIGLIGCGGRGTGAAIQAASSCPAVELTCLADQFADHLDASAERIAAAVGGALRCPPGRRHVGGDAWRHVIDADVDLVILATPPHLRPAQVAAAVAAGKHVWCEPPGAIDAAGVIALEAACREARRRGLAVGSGLCSRHDPALVALMGRLHEDRGDRPREVVMRQVIGLPWIRPADPAWTAAETRLRNWVWYPEFSGGHLVEHHADAIDRGLWALGDDVPAAVLPLVPGTGPRPGPGSAPGAPGRLAGPACRSESAVRYLFADGRMLEAGIVRREGGPDRFEETVRGPRGGIDLRAAVAGRSLDLHAVAIGRLVRGILGGDRIDESPALLRTTRATVLGRLAVATGRTLAWAEFPAADPQPVRPLQSTRA